MSNIRDGVPVYGYNTAYGGRAGRVLNEGLEEERMAEARKLSEALVFLDVGVGEPLPKEESCSLQQSLLVLRSIGIQSCLSRIHQAVQ